MNPKSLFSEPKPLLLRDISPGIRVTFIEDSTAVVLDARIGFGIRTTTVCLYQNALGESSEYQQYGYRYAYSLTCSRFGPGGYTGGARVSDVRRAHPVCPDCGEE